MTQNNKDTKIKKEAKIITDVIKENKSTTIGVIEKSNDKIILDNKNSSKNNDVKDITDVIKENKSTTKGVIAKSNKIVLDNKNSSKNNDAKEKQVKHNTPE